MVRVWRKFPLFLEQFSYVHYSHIHKGLIQIVSTLLLKYNKYRRQHKWYISIHFYFSFNIFRSAIDIVSRENISVIVFTTINPL